MNNNVEQPTIVLCTADYNKLGNLNSVTDIVYKDNMNAANSLSFTVHKRIDGKCCHLWNDITDFKLVWLKEYNEYYKISVSISEKNESVKNVTATALCEDELSQIPLTIDINSDDDIELHNYVRTIFYNESNPDCSLLHRILSNAPHYTIKHVDSSIANEIKIFSVDGTSIYDFLVGELSEEIGCLFIFDSADRSISVYDLENCCIKCGKRGDFTDICPDCDYETIKPGYGEDTTIFINTDNLAQEISLSSNVSQIKNCFKVVGGDDDINAAVRNISPNGSEYITAFSQNDYMNMPDVLVGKLYEYDNLVSDKQEEYLEIAKLWYEEKDKELYLESSMMPDITHDIGTAADQIAKLTTGSLSPVAIKDISNASSYTADSAVLGMAKCLVDTTNFKIEIVEKSSSFTSQTWRGQFVVTSYVKDDDGNADTATSSEIAVELNDNEQQFIEQKVRRAIAKNEDSYLSDIFAIEDYTVFVNELKLYSLNRLKSFEDAYQSCIEILQECGCGDTESTFYESLYSPYCSRLDAIRKEYKIRKEELEEVQQRQEKLEQGQHEIRDLLNFEKYLGMDLYKLYYSFLRIDKYENSNYISDGLSNEEVLTKAKELIEKAKKELVKASERQYTISATLDNLLIMKEFAPIVNHFQTGNYIRARIDDVIYKMRLLSYEIHFASDSIQTISVEFSDVINAKNNALGLKDVLDQAASVASSFPALITQVNQNTDNALIAPNWVQNGLDLATVTIVNTADNQNMLMDSHGLWMRSYDDILCEYSPCQAKLQNNGLYITKDHWKSIEVGIGEFTYIDPADGITRQEYGIIAKKIIGKQILGEKRFGIYNADNTMEFTDNGLVITTNGDDTKLSNAFTVQKRYTNNGTQVIQRQLFIDEDGNVTLGGGAKIKWSAVNSPSVDDVNGLNDKIADFTKSLNDSVADLQNQIDGNITTWFYDDVPTLDNAPVNEWTTEKDKNTHLGDLYYDNLTGYAYRFQFVNGLYSWERITDTDITKALADAKNAQDTADNKRRVFVVTPTPPYDIGDLWVQGAGGDIMHCQTARSSGQNYVSSDWTQSSKYTDDTLANRAMTLAGSAKTLGNELRTYLGLTTEISSDYIISPFIGGGYLKIENTTDHNSVIIDPLGKTNPDYIFGVYNNNHLVMGVDTNGNGMFSGNITATTGQISHFKIDANGIFNVSDSGDVDSAGNSIPVGCGMQRFTKGSAFWAGAGGVGNGGENAEFQVWHDGSLFSTRGKIGGWDITSTELSYSVDGTVRSKLSPHELWVSKEGAAENYTHVMPSQFYTNAMVDGHNYVFHVDMRKGTLSIFDDADPNIAVFTIDVAQKRIDIGDDWTTPWQNKSPE